MTAVTILVVAVLAFVLGWLGGVLYATPGDPAGPDPDYPFGPRDA